MLTKKKATITMIILSLVFSLLGVTGVSAIGPTVKWVDQVGGSDSNDGNTEATAYASLQEAIEESESGTATERSFIYVKNGTYGKTGLLSTSACQGTSYPTAILIKDLDYLTIQAVDGQEPVVKPMTSVSTDIVSVSIENANHLVIDNLDSDQTSAQFDNWHVCNSNDLAVRNSTFQGGEDGIDFNTSLDTALIEKNTFIDIDTGSGDEVLDFTDSTYANVTIQDNLFENNYRQITIFPPSGSSATNFLIRRNNMKSTNNQEAVRLIGPDGVTLENNVIMNSQQQGVYIDVGSKNINIWHNSFFNNGFEELRTNVSASDILIKNNIFYANGAYAALAAPTASLLGEDFNLIYNAGANRESSSQVAVTAYGANTITGLNPLFASTAAGSEDLHLQSASPAIQAGVDLGVNEDLEQNTRPNPAGSDPDLGAYEFGVVDELGPITSNLFANPNPAPVNTAILLTATVDDSTTGGSNIASAEYSLDGGTFTPMSAQDSAFGEVSEQVEATIPAFIEPGVHEVCVRGTDAAGNTGAAECILLAVYDPSAGFVTGGGWINSPAGAAEPIPTLVWDQGFETDTAGWLDGNSGWYGTVTRVASGSGGITSSSGSYHAIFEEDANSASFSRFDGYRDTWPGTWSAEIDVYLDPAWASSAGFDYSVAATGSDGNHQRDYIFHVTKDTSTGKLYVAGSNNTNFAPREDLENINHYEVATAGWYTFQHVFYEQSGALAVDLNLLDASGNVLFTETRFNAADTIPAEVGGNRYAWFTFINVAGGIAVDEHQLQLLVSPTGKATFGFVSKYKKGATVPEGQTEFQFKAAGLNFHSNTYEWLVVAGAKAQFKGSGTINSAGEYKFILTAIDADVNKNDSFTIDRFRIKIWYEENGSEVVVYDNALGSDDDNDTTEIGGGSIVIHKK